MLKLFSILSFVTVFFVSGPVQSQVPCYGDFEVCSDGITCCDRPSSKCCGPSKCCKSSKALPPAPKKPLSSAKKQKIKKEGLMRKLLSILSFVVILIGSISVNAEVPKCSADISCGEGEICCQNSINKRWGCCPQGMNCYAEGNCCHPDHYCDGACCELPCDKNKKCPSGASTSPSEPAVQATNPTRLHKL